MKGDDDGLAVPGADAVAAAEPAVVKPGALEELVEGAGSCRRLASTSSARLMLALVLWRLAICATLVSAACGPMKSQ